MRGVPTGNAGKYEEHIAAQSKPVNSRVTALACTDEDVEHVAAFFIAEDAALVNAVQAPVPEIPQAEAVQEHDETADEPSMVACLDGIPDFQHDSSLQALAAEDDDHADLVEALREPSANVKVCQTLSQEIRKATTLSPQRIAAIAKKVNSGEIKLPDLVDEPKTDDDWGCCLGARRQRCFRMLS